MARIKDYLDYAELAEIAYGDLTIGTPGMDDLTNPLGIDFTNKQAKIFSERYEVKAVYNSSSGFSATMFRDTDTDKKIITIRGTEGDGDYYADWELVLKRSPEQFESLVDFFEELKSSNKISKSDNLIVVGHSLGGALTQMAVATYKDYVDEAYTFNAPGSKGISNPNVMEYQGEYYRNYEVLSGGVVTGERISKELYEAYKLFEINKTEVDSKVTNIEAIDGPSLITDLGVDMGSKEEVYINADNDFGYNHSSKTLTKTLSFYNALISIDSTLSIPEITRFLEWSDYHNSYKE